MNNPGHNETFNAAAEELRRTKERHDKTVGDKAHQWHEAALDLTQIDEEGND